MTCALLSKMDKIKFTIPDHGLNRVFFFFFFFFSEIDSECRNLQGNSDVAKQRCPNIFVIFLSIMVEFMQQ